MHKQDGFSHILVFVLIIAVLGAGGFAFWRVSMGQGKQISSTPIPSATSKTATEDSKNAAQAQQTTVRILAANGQQETVKLDSTQVFKLKLSNGQVYYGLPSKINDEYLRLSNVMYMTGTVLTVLGNELHAPESIMYIRIGSIAQLDQLASSENAYDAIIAASKSDRFTISKDAYPSSAIASYLKKDHYQAFFMKDGQTTYFAKGVTFSGNLFKNVQYVYSLKQSNQNDMTMIVAPRENVDSLSVSDVVFFENLKDDGHIVKAAEDYSKAQ